MKNKLIIGLFCCLVLIQLAVSSSMIIKRENVLKNGEQFKFKTAPVDPYDAFRGRYVALRVEESSLVYPEESKLNWGETVYAVISVDEQGFAKLGPITVKPPQDHSYIKTKVQSLYGGKLNLELPFERYYMEEKSAPKAEAVYREHNMRGKQDAYILVRVKDGLAVIEALYVGGRPIEELIKEAK